MDYFYYILGTWAIMLLLFKLASAELEGYLAKKRYNIRWLLLFKTPFSYRRANNIILVSILCYLFSTTRNISTIWFIEMIVFIAVGVVVDALGQYIAYQYIKIRFGKRIREAGLLEAEIKSALLKEDVDLVREDTPTFDVRTVMKEYMQKDDHVAIISMDGGKFVAETTDLPAITYVVESAVEEAKTRLAGGGIKVTSYASQNKMPFKDEKLNVIVNELTNYDKFEMYRVLQSNGYFIVDQMGSDNYQEIANMFLPFRMRRRWDKENCSQTLKDIGLDIVDSFEHIGYLRFKSLSAVFTFMRSFSPERVQEYDKFLNFYARILQEIKQNNFFDLTTHRFLIVAKKQ